MNYRTKKSNQAMAVVTCLLGVAVILLIGERAKVVRLEREPAVIYLRTMSAPEVPIPTTEPVDDVSTTEIQTAYAGNQSAADTRFEGALLQVTGDVAAVGKSDGGARTLMLKYGDDDSSIICCFENSDYPVLAGLCPGAIVSVRGRFTRTGPNMFLNDCTLEMGSRTSFSSLIRGGPPAGGLFVGGEWYNRQLTRTRLFQYGGRAFERFNYPLSPKSTVPALQ